MKIEGQGFLSIDVLNIKAEIERHYPGLWLFALDVNSFADEFQYKLNIHADEISEVMSATLYARVVSNYQDLLLVASHGMQDQSRILLRVLVETLFPLVAISKDKAFTELFIEHESFQRKKALSKLKRFRESQNPADPGIETLNHKIDEIQSGIKSGGLKYLSTEEIARKAGLHSWYDTVYSSTSSDVHTSARSLQSHLVMHKDNGSIKEFKNKPEIIDINLPVGTGIEVLLIAISSCCKIFSIPSPVKLDAFGKKLRDGGMIDFTEEMAS